MKNKANSKQRRANKALAAKLAAAHAEIASLKKTIQVITQIALEGNAEHQKEKAELLRVAYGLVDELVNLRRAKDAGA